MNSSNHEMPARLNPMTYGRASEAPTRSNSETRLQAAVVLPRPRQLDEKSDPDADVPCTD